ncbi:MAG: GntR family transcriptional regulator [Pseudomonadota bacterium]
MPQAKKAHLDFNSALPLYYQLKELIKERIADNTWKQGQMIPSENEMAEMFSVSPGTVKKSFAELCNEGVLYRRQGKGTFVSKPDFGRTFFRFFRYGLGENEAGIIPGSNVLTSQVIIPSESVRATLKLPVEEKVICIQRIRTLMDVPLMVEDLYLPERIFRGFDGIDISNKLLYPIFDERYGTPIIWADEFLAPRVADLKTAEALGIEKGDPVIFVERIAYTYGDRPVEFRSGFGRGDRFRYNIQIR